MATFDENEPPAQTLEGVSEDGEPLKAPALAYQTRLERYELQEGGIEP